MFFIPLDKIPSVTSQQKGVKVIKGKPHFFEKKKVAEARAIYYGNLYDHKPTKPLQGAVRVDMVIQYPMAKGKSPLTFKITRPDLDNTAKLILDVMTDLGFWNDDAQIASLELTKLYHEKSGIYIRVTELDGKLDDFYFGQELAKGLRK